MKMNTLKKLPFLSLFFVLLFASFAEAEVKSEIKEIQQLIYNNDFRSAKIKIHYYISANPEDPNGYLLQGMAYDWEQICHNRDKKSNKIIMSSYESARQLALKHYEKDRNNLDKITTLSNAYIYNGKKLLDMGRKLAAGQSIKKARNLMEDVIKKDPNNADVYFPIGLFNYFSENVPSGLKWLASLLGFSGDAKKGIKYITKAAGSDTLTKTDALFILFYIYSRKESNFKAALPYAQQLHHQYPNNPIFLLIYSEMQLRNQDIEGSRTGFEKFLGFCKDNKGYCSAEDRFLANHYLTWGYIEQERHADAKPYLEAERKLIQANATNDENKKTQAEEWYGLLKQKGLIN